MAKKKKNIKLNFNGGWTMGEASHHISKKMTVKTHKSKKVYNRKKKHKGNEDLT